MSYETYVNLLRVFEERKRQAAYTGDWKIVAEMCDEIIQLRIQFDKENKG